MTLTTKLQALLAAATTAREQQRQEALEDLEALRALLPVPKAGPQRARAAALLTDLTDRATLRALGAKTPAALLRAHRLRLTLATTRRLLTEHQQSQRPIPKSAKQRLATLERNIHRALRAGDAGAYDIGKLVDQVAWQRLHRLGGSKRTLAEWADATFPRHGYRTLARYRRIAKSFAKRLVLTHGILKLDLGLQYLDLTPADDRPADLLRAEILVPQKGRILFPKITTADLSKAVDALRTERSTTTPLRLPRGATRILTDLRRTLAAVQVPEGITAPTITARVTRALNRAHVLFTAQNLPPQIAQRLLATPGNP